MYIAGKFMSRHNRIPCQICPFSIIMVMLFLPQLLMVFDKLIDKTALTRGERRRKDEA